MEPQNGAIQGQSRGTGLFRNLSGKSAINWKTTLNAEDGIVMNYYFGVVLCVFLLAGCQPETTEKQPPPYALPDTVSTPQIFAAGIVSSELPEFATTFSPDGQTVYFNLASADRGILKIAMSAYKAGKWQAPVVLPFADGTYRDIDPFVTADGKRLYFSSNRPLSPDGQPADFNTWFVERSEDGWGNPQSAGEPVNSSATEIFVSLAKNGNLYLSGDLLGENTWTIFRSQYQAGKYATPTRVDLGLPDTVSVGNPLISPEEDFLIFATRSLPGLGGSDLFISYRENGKWTAAKNLGAPINSPYAEFAPCLSPDGEYLFFTSERPGVVGKDELPGRPPGDIYQVRLPARD